MSGLYLFFHFFYQKTVYILTLVNYNLSNNFLVTITHKYSLHIFLYLHILDVKRAVLYTFFITTMNMLAMTDKMQRTIT